MDKPDALLSSTAPSLADKLDDRQRSTLDSLNGYYPDEAATLAAILSDDDKLQDIILDLADRRVSIWNAERLEWLAANPHRADQPEAIACGARTVDDIAAYCWYQAEREDIMEDIEAIRCKIDV